MAVKKIQITADAGAESAPAPGAEVVLGPGAAEALIRRHANEAAADALGHGGVVLDRALLAGLADAARRHFEELLASALRRLEGQPAGRADSVRLEVPGLTVRMTPAEMKAAVRAE